MLAITICATKSYSYALLAQARRVVANLAEVGGQQSEVSVILVGDDSDEIRSAKEFYSSVVPAGCTVTLLTGKYEDGLPNYKNAAQLIIARMRSTAFDRARQLNADLCWSLDSDVLPPANALRCMKQMLEFDYGYYSVSTCPYPSQGGGDFLGGRGTPENPILPDFYDDERTVPVSLRKRMKAHLKKRSEVRDPAAAGKLQSDEEWHREREAISDEVKKCAPIGDVFFCNSNSRPATKENPRRGFRRRGWMSAAYPGIGLGAVLPTDWCGFGCTLMNKRALALAQFDGYDGAGTEDLYICWKRWYRAGLRLNVIPHAPCDHVIRAEVGGQRSEVSKEKLSAPPRYTLCQAHHESKDPECIGHLRIERRPWYQQADGEIYQSDV